MALNETETAEAAADEPRMALAEHDGPAPRVHLNGTARTDLLRQLSEAEAAVTVALEKLALASPHGRDYYVQEPGTYTRAVAAHGSRCARLRAVRAELAALAANVAAQGRK